MQLAEMRSALDAGNAKRGFPALPDTAPDWAIRSIYERRNGLELTPLPQGIEVRSAASISAASRIQRAKAIIQEHTAYLQRKY